ncbi:MAG: response regulator transcription factor [Anaerolineae bacterium]|nr:response regulator transcription factor [Anaerolineae bacterium]
MKSLRILVVDDDGDTRKILTDCLSAQGYVVVTASDGAEAWTRTMEHLPHLILLDVVLPDLSGLELISRLKELDSDIEIVLITAYSTVDQAVQAIRQGAFSYLQKPLVLSQVLATVKEALKVRLERQYALTDRELCVLRRLAQGHTNARIAKELGITERTACFHVENLFQKLHTTNRTQAVVEAIRRGWLKV